MCKSRSGKGEEKKTRRTDGRTADVHLQKESTGIYAYTLNYIEVCYCPLPLPLPLLLHRTDGSVGALRCNHKRFFFSFLFFSEGSLFLLLLSFFVLFLFFPLSYEDRGRRYPSLEWTRAWLTNISHESGTIPHEWNSIFFGLVGENKNVTTPKKGKHVHPWNNTEREPFE